jgi:hypothetical protein
LPGFPLDDRVFRCFQASYRLSICHTDTFQSFFSFDDISDKTTDLVSDTDLELLEWMRNVAHIVTDRWGGLTFKYNSFLIFNILNNSKEFAAYLRRIYKTPATIDQSEFGSLELISSGLSAMVERLNAAGFHRRKIDGQEAIFSDPMCRLSETSGFLPGCVAPFTLPQFILFHEALRAQAFGGGEWPRKPIPPTPQRHTRRST